MRIVSKHTRFVIKKKHLDVVTSYSHTQISVSILQECRDSYQTNAILYLSFIYSLMKSTPLGGIYMTGYYGYTY